MAWPPPVPLPYLSVSLALAAKIPLLTDAVEVGNVHIFLNSYPHYKWVFSPLAPILTTDEPGSRNG